MNLRLLYFQIFFTLTSFFQTAEASCIQRALNDLLGQGPTPRLSAVRTAGESTALPALTRGRLIEEITNNPKAMEKIRGLGFTTPDEFLDFIKVTTCR